MKLMSALVQFRLIFPFDLFISVFFSPTSKYPSLFGSCVCVNLALHFTKYVESYLVAVDFLNTHQLS